MEFLTCAFEVKADDSTGYITGYGSIFGNIDSYGDVVAKGAFKKPIADVMTGAKSWPAMLLQHGDATSDGKTPIGIWTNMEEDDRGLRLEGELAIKNRRGSEAYALLKMKPCPLLTDCQSAIDAPTTNSKRQAVRHAAPLKPWTLSKCLW